MALISCPECKKEISETAQACPQCGYDLKAAMEREKAAREQEKAAKDLEKAKAKLAQAQAESSRQIKKMWVWLFVIVVGIFLVNYLTSDTIAYESPYPGLILVNEKATKGEVMALATRLYKTKREFVIYDSREALEYQERNDFLSAAAHYGKHILVICENGDPPEWVAKKRDH